MVPPLVPTNDSSPHINAKFHRVGLGFTPPAFTPGSVPQLLEEEIRGRSPIWYDLGYSNKSSMHGRG